MSKSVYLSPGQLLEQEKWCLAPGLKSRDKAFPPVGQSHDPRSCSSSHLHTHQSTFCSHEQKASLHPGQVHTQPIGHFHDDTCWKWDNQTLRCRKKSQLLSRWSCSTNLFLFDCGREGFLSVSGICTQPSTPPAEHVRSWPPEAKCKPSICFDPTLLYWLWL